MVPLATIKSALRIDYTADDEELTRLRDAALSFIERRTQLVLKPAAQTLYLTSWRDSTIPAVPFLSLTSVTYYDAANALTTMPAADYWLDRSEGPMPVLRFLERPGLYEGTAISVAYQAGYAALPSELVHAVIGLTGHWYNNPEAAQPVAMATVPMGVHYILENLSSRSSIR